MKTRRCRQCYRMIRVRKDGVFVRHPMRRRTPQDGPRSVSECPASLTFGERAAPPGEE